MQFIKLPAYHCFAAKMPFLYFSLLLLYNKKEHCFVFGAQ